MRGMRFVGQGIQEQHIQVPQLLHGRFRNLAVIGQIGSVAEAESVDRLEPVYNGNEKELQAEQVERRSIEQARVQLRNVGLLLHAIEDILEAAPDRGHGVLRGEDRNLRAPAEVERPHVVQAHDVVGMRMGEEDRVQTFHARTQRLGPEIRRGIDQDIVAVVTDQDRGPQPLVPGIVGRADGAMTPDGGHPHAGSGTEDRDLRGWLHIQAFCAAALATWSEICTKRNRNSVREFSSRRCSSSVRLPLVFSSRMPIRSMVWRAIVSSGPDFSSSPKGISPSCISHCARSESTKKVKDAGGSSGWYSS